MKKCRKFERNIFQVNFEVFFFKFNKNFREFLLTSFFTFFELRCRAQPLWLKTPSDQLVILPFEKIIFKKN